MGSKAVKIVTVFRTLSSDFRDIRFILGKAKFDFEASSVEGIGSFHLINCIFD